MLQQGSKVFIIDNSGVIWVRFIRKIRGGQNQTSFLFLASVLVSENYKAFEKGSLVYCVYIIGSAYPTSSALLKSFWFKLCHDYKNQAVIVSKNSYELMFTRVLKGLPFSLRKQGFVKLLLLAPCFF